MRFNVPAILCAILATSQVVSATPAPPNIASRSKLDEALAKRSDAPTQDVNDQPLTAQRVMDFADDV